MSLTAVEVKAFIAYYRTLADQARESKEGLDARGREVLTINITVGERNYPLVEVPVHIEQSKDFAEVILGQIQNFCYQRAQELETQLSAVACR